MWGVAANDAPIDPAPSASAAIIPSLVSTTISERGRSRFLAADHEGPAEHLPCVLVAPLDRVVAVEVVWAGRNHVQFDRQGGQLPGRPRKPLRSRLFGLPPQQEADRLCASFSYPLATDEQACISSH